MSWKSICTKCHSLKCWQYKGSPEIFIYCLWECKVVSTTTLENWLLQNICLHWHSEAANKVYLQWEDRVSDWTTRISHRNFGVPR